MRASDWYVKEYRGYWALFWYDGKGKRHRTSLGPKVLSKQDALLAAPTALKLHNKQPEAAARTVGQIVEDYLKRSDAITIKTLTFHWKYAEPTFGKLLPGQVTEDVCRKYAKDRGVSDGTILKELGLIRAALRKAGATEARFRMPRQPAPRDKRLTREQVNALTGACKQAHILLFVLIARYTAARMSAILSLRWDQVDFDARMIHLGGTGRQKKRATVPMLDELALPLAIAKQAAVSPYVIEYGGMRVASVKKAFKAACDRAGIKDASPHVMRHTAASWMAEDGVPMREIGQFLGHTNESVTYRVYARYSPDYLRGAMASLSDSRRKGS